MAHYFHYIKNELAPFKDLARLLDHLWADELRDYVGSPNPRHVFHHLVAVANWLNAGTDWTPDQYVAAWESSPESKWLAARSAPARRDATPPGLAAASDTRPQWEHEGVGSRYRVRGKRPSLTVIVGWDRPLNTYFVQVWDVPDGARQYEHGDLVLWAGTTWDEITSPDELVALLAEYAELPPDLLARVAADREAGAEPR